MSLKTIIHKATYEAAEACTIIEPVMNRDRAERIMLALSNLDDEIIAEAAEAFNSIRISNERKKAIWDRLAPLASDKPIKQIKD